MKPVKIIPHKNRKNFIDTTDYIFTCNTGKYKLTLIDFSYKRYPGRKYYTYRFINPNGIEIFSGFDFSTHESTPQIDAVYSLLGFLTTREGDTDEDYFNNYNPEQLNFIRSWDCEELALQVYDHDNPTQSELF